jgi:hypothetical protein
MAVARGATPARSGVQRVRAVGTNAEVRPDGLAPRWTGAAVTAGYARLGTLGASPEALATGTSGWAGRFGRRRPVMGGVTPVTARAEPPIRGLLSGQPRTLD